MSQALYRKWRPSIWADVVGQTHVVETLNNAVSAERHAHAYLFAGPRGTGKTSVARILAKALNCLHEDLTKRPDDTCEHCLAVNTASFLDLIEIDAASNTSVEDIRDLRDKINFSPNRARYKVYIIDEVHMLSNAAFNALLKTLEEPPPHAIFILATTEVHKIPATVLSRCQRHEFRRISSAEIIPHLEKIVAAEKIQIETDALALIARQATGSMRDAISLLDQLSSMGDKVDLAFAREVLGTATQQAVLDLTNAIAANDSQQGLALIHQALDSGSAARQLARQMVDYLRMLLLVSMGGEVPAELGAEEAGHLQTQAAKLTPKRLLAIIQHFNRAALDARNHWQPGLALELAFIESLEENQPTSASKPAKKTETVAQVQPVKTSPKEASPQQSAPAKDTLDENQWGTLKQAVKSASPNLAALLNSCRLRELKGNQLMLGFASDVLKEKMEKEDNLRALEEAIKGTLGLDLQVACFVTQADAKTLPEGLDSSSMVATAMRLGGEIVDENDLSKNQD